MNFCTGSLITILGLMVAIPAFGYFFSPLRKRRGQNGSGLVDVGALSEFPVGQWRLRALEMNQEDGWKKTRVRHAIWVHREPGSQEPPVVLSSICPHLGCPINWHAEESRFFCPCHGGVFDATGKRVSGPPPRGMDRLNCEVRAGRLLVQWHDFKIGVAERVAVSA
jgi:Rieske Fe-S protein